MSSHVPPSLSRRPPNVLYVFADQWPAHAFGYTGDPNVRTPRIDAFAREAVNCRHAFANMPICSPSRATLLTGLLPDRHGIVLNDAPLDPNCYTLGEHFSANGYDTAYIGKWHVDGHGRRSFTPPERRHGFQYWKAIECTHNYNASRYFEGDDPTPKRWPTYDAFAQTDDAIAYLRDHDRERPFFMVLSWGPPHFPYETAPERFRKLYRAEQLQLRPNVPGDFEPAREMLAGFYAHCSALDECFGRLVDALREIGIEDHTILVFTSDHGDHLGAHYLSDKQSPLEEALHIPFLIRWPDALKPHANDSVVSVLDVFPTLCGFLGQEIPEQCQGRDFSAHLREQSAPEAEENFAFCGSYHTFGPWLRQSRIRPVPEHLRARDYRGLRDTRYTYCESLEGPWLLFDNETDPYQLRNLIDDDAHRGLRARLAGRLHRRMEAYGDAFLPGMSYVSRWGYQVNKILAIPYDNDGDSHCIAPSIP